MRGFLLGSLALTMLEVVLSGQTTGSGGNISGLLAFPARVARKFLDPGEPFFNAGKFGAASSSTSTSSSASPSSSTTSTAAAPSSPLTAGVTV